MEAKPLTHQFQAETLADYADVARGVLDLARDVRIFALHGNLGAGKTTFIKSLCASLGVEESVSSPTFSLVHTYVGRAGEVYHFDFYRLESEDEADQIGAEEYFYSGNYVFIEWPERISGLLPDETAHIFIQIVQGTTRQIELSYWPDGEN